MSILQACQAMQDSAFGMALLGSRYMFPLVETTHVLCLSLSVGLLAIVDLRLIGLSMAARPVDAVLRMLRPWMLGGFVAMFLTGVLLFWSEAANVYVKPMFRLKLLFLALAGINALCFEWRLGRRVSEWGNRAILPKSARFAGYASLLCWAVVILCGRWVAYGV
jgi:hypothetical protein